MTINSFIQAGKWMCFAAAVLLTAACEKHQDTIDYSLRVGNIYCADGRVIPPEVYDNTSDYAIAVIVKLGDTQCGYKALAVGLKEWKAAASNKLTAFNGVGESRDDMKGKANTAAMLDAMFTEKPSGPDSGQLYFNKIDRLQGTARSNKVSIALGFQSKEQLEKDYGKEVSGALLNIFGTVVCAASCGKDTVEWLSNDVFGKIKQLKEGKSVTRDSTTHSLNEELQPLVPADKIANMPAGWLCGMTARSFRPLKTGRNGSIDISKSDEFKPSKFYAKTNFDMKAIADEEAQYVEIPKFYKLGNSDRDKQEILAKNFQRIRNEVNHVVETVLGKVID